MAILSAEQREHFLAKGFIKLHQCFSRESAEELKAKAWVRLGYDAADAGTWTKPRIHMPGLTHFPTKEFAPKAYEAACELCGGEERIQTPWNWGDSFIVSLDEGSDLPWSPPSPTQGGWHKDGDFFRHFLDSPEQGLLTLVLWSDIKHQGSATFLAPDSVPIIAKFLAERPEGVLPGGFPFKEMIGKCKDIVECTGETGDVFLIHPFALHSVSQNRLRTPRFLTNPPIHLLEPMEFNRKDPADFSLVEQCTLRSLGVDRLDFKPTSPREKVVPERVRRQEKMLQEEQQRLAAAN